MGEQIYLARNSFKIFRGKLSKIHKCCLTRPEEAGDDGDGGEFVLFAVGHGDEFCGDRCCAVDDKWEKISMDCDRIFGGGQAI